MEYLIIELELVGKIKIGDKLNISNQNQTSVSIEHPTFYSSFTRWYYEDGRDKTAEYLQSLVTRTSEKISGIDITDRNRLIRATYNAMSGIKCLVFTYASDLAYVTRLENILQQMELLWQNKV